MQAIVPDREKSTKYTGQVTGGALKKWALQQVPSHVSVLRATSDFKKLMQASSMSKSQGSTGAGAEWAAAAVLVTDSTDVSSLWKAMSTRYRGKVCLRVRCSVCKHNATNASCAPFSCDKSLHMNTA
jgi:hypothetical protein